MINKIIILVIILFFAKLIVAQESPKTLNAEQVLNVVRSFHPVIRQSYIGVEKSKSEILNARGNFDPVFSNYLGKKTFDGQNYYNDISPELKIPIWYGADIYAGLEDLTGDRLDPSQSEGQSSFVGINIPLVKNLVIDKRRAFLKQAKIYSSMAELDQNIMINDLCMDAISAYWAWVKAYETYAVVANKVRVDEKRLELIRKWIENGERPAVDSIEAITQLQSFQYRKNENWLEFQNAGLLLSAFMWTKDNNPYQLPESVIPEGNWEFETLLTNFNLDLTILLSEAQLNHPYLKIYNYKLDVLDIDKKLKFQELLPKVDFRYNFLAKSYSIDKTITDASPFQNNYQYMLKAEIPLFFSQGRANYKIAKLKIEETKLEQNQKELDIQLKIKSYYNEFVTLKNQVDLQNKYAENYQKLVRAEETLLENGESTLFLINSRENKALEAQEKLIEIKTKYFKSIYALQWSAGLLR